MGSSSLQTAAAVTAPQESREPLATGLLSSISALIEPQVNAVNKEIEVRLSSDIALINRLSSYIIYSGGKRLRPVALLLSAKAFGYQGQADIALAAVIEFIHTATLLHDDVVDTSSLRRGKASANEVWGNEASVLVGDFLYSRAFEMMVEVGDMRVMEIMATTTNIIAEGEVMQLLNCHSADVTEEQYLETIFRKTAKLFESATQLGAVISGQPDSIQAAMISYGKHLGIAFQLIDDVLDYNGDSADTGKNVGDDLSEGKPTLPMIHAYKYGSEKQRNILRNAIENGGCENIEVVLEIIESTESLDYTSRLARKQTEKAKQALVGIPESPYKQALIELADFSSARSY